MKKLLSLLVTAFVLCLATPQVFAEPGSPIYSYSIDAQTSYGTGNRDNIAPVKMIKPGRMEEYEIQFFKDYFVVIFAASDNPVQHAQLQKEVGVKQKYGPNPRVNAVLTALLQKNGLPRDLANEYQPFIINNESEAGKLLYQFMHAFHPQLGQNWFMELERSYLPEYFGSLYTYVYHVKAIKGPDSKLYAEYKIDELGVIEESRVKKITGDGKTIYELPKRYKLDGHKVVPL